VSGPVSGEEKELIGGPHMSVSKTRRRDTDSGAGLAGHGPSSWPGPVSLPVAPSYFFLNSIFLFLF
jgi:hypothetical protein